MIQLAPDLTLRSEAGPEATILDAEGLGRVLLLFDAGTARIEGLTIQNGLTTLGDGILNYGGGIYSLGDSRPTISNCVVRNNHGLLGTNGAGIHCFGPEATITNCQILDNWGDGQSDGGGITCRNCTIVDCVVRGNAVYGSEGSSCGGIYSFNSTILRCWIEGNMVITGRGAVGGGVRAVEGHTRITDSTFIGNKVHGGISSNGSGVYVGAVRCSITNCIFAGNEGIPSLGAVVAGGSGAALTITGSTIVGNRAVGPQATAGVYLSDLNGTSTGSVTGTIIAGNEGAACLGNTLVFSCSDLFGNSDDAICGVDAGGNLNLDPGFCAVAPAASLNFSLQADSPCAPGNHPQGACGLIGAAPVGCETVGIQSETWGRVKSLYRR